MQVGDVVRAKVVGVHAYGIDVEADGLLGFVQVIDLSWTPGVLPTEVAEVGAALDVAVLAVEGGRFSASIKDAHPERDPWLHAATFDVGSVHVGVVVRVMDWGVAVAIRPGVIGMVLGPSNATVGARVAVTVRHCQREQRKLELVLGG